MNNHDLERMAEMASILRDTMAKNEQFLPEGTTKEVYSYCLIRMDQILSAIAGEAASLARWPEEGE